MKGFEAIQFFINNNEEDNTKMKFIDEILDNQKELAKVALIEIKNEKKISYKDLKIHSYKLANILLNHGIKPNDRVIIYLKKSIEAIINIFGILKSGGTYVPIDYSFPPDRIGYIISNCKPAFIITNSDGLRKINHIIKDKVINILVMDCYEQNSSYSIQGNMNIINWIRGMRTVLRNTIIKI